ncbi:MAG: arginine--tRNA ligase [Pseudomonadota bacterium]|nr:arginine--tRNA ligase [Pseudomonadota bacterium]
MNLFAQFETRLHGILVDLQTAGVLPPGAGFDNVTVEPPRDAVHGDVSTNAAMVLCKQAGMPPRDLAEQIVDRLAAETDIQGADIAGPGFVNVTFKKEVWSGLVPAILAAGEAYGVADIGNGQAVNLEYVSANPTGPMHVGHARGAVFGDALARLLERAGYTVLREYYINDAGSQVDVLARSALLRAREALGEDIGEIPTGLYPGDYLIPVGEALAEAEGAALFDKDEASQITIAKQVALPMMMDQIREDLAALGVTHSHFLSEQSLHDNGAVDIAFETLQAQNLIYHGVLEPPKGKEPPPDWEPQPQWLFRSQQFGDDCDRALKKSDNSWTYFAPDIAYHFDKFQRGFTRMIDVWGADHIGYIKRMQAAVSAITQGAGQLDVKVCNLVKLQRGGEPIKMSKRSGDFVTLREVVDEVGRNAVRFMMLTRRNDAALDFDFDLVKQQSRDNPVFYVQYAHARIHSVLRNAEDVGFTPDELSAAALGTADAGLLRAPEEIALAKVLGVYPRILLGAALALEPHRLAFYLQDLAAAFHGLWTRGKEDPSLRFIQDDNRNLTVARLALLRATAIVLANGLNVIGVEPETEMR